MREPKSYLEFEIQAGVRAVPWDERVAFAIANGYTKNDIRKMADLPPIEGGDEPICQP